MTLEQGLVAGMRVCPGGLSSGWGSPGREGLFMGFCASNAKTSAFAPPV